MSFSAIQQIANARAMFLKYASGPAPRDIYERLRWTMAGTHTVINESFEVIYKNAESVPPHQQTDFAGYALLFVKYLNTHHDFEETTGFPMMEPEFTCPAIQEHSMFTGGLSEMERYLESVLGLTKNAEGKTITARNRHQVPYEGKKLKGILDTIAEPLCFHLTQEITYLDPQALKDCGLSVGKMEALEKASNAYFRGHINILTDAVFTFLHVPPSIGFPPAPSFVRYGLIPWVFYWPYRRLWQFAPKFATAT